MTDSNAEFPIPKNSETKPTKVSTPVIPSQPAGDSPAFDSTTATVASIQQELADEITRTPRRDIYKGYLGGAVEDRNTTFYSIDINGFSSEQRPKISIDHVISSAIEAAIAHGRDEVVIFDFGCGRGDFFKSIIKGGENDILRQTTEMIRNHPNLRVKLLGLTDVTGLQARRMSDQELANGTDLKNPEAEPKNLSAHIDYYGVTAAQTLEKYLDSKGITTIDVAFAVQSLPYLPANNFEAVLETIIARLRPGIGTFASGPYASQVPGFFEEYTPYNYHDEDFHFSNLIKKTPDRPSLQSTLREKGKRFTKPDADIHQEVALLQAAFEKYKELGVLSQEKIDENIDRLLPLATRGLNRVTNQHPKLEQLLGNKNDRTNLETIATALLSRAEHGLGEKRREQLREKKKAVLARLKTKHKDNGDADIDFDYSYIRVKKK